MAARNLRIVALEDEVQALGERIPEQDAVIEALTQAVRDRPSVAGLRRDLDAALTAYGRQARRSDHVRAEPVPDRRGA